jgi:hypothetical protein
MTATDPTVPRTPGAQHDGLSQAGADVQANVGEIRSALDSAKTELTSLQGKVKGAIQTFKASQDGQ